jgi:hypothetical protein
VTVTLSSRWTPFYKFIAPLLAVGGIGFGAWRGYVDPERLRMPPGVTPEYGWVLLLAIAVLAGVIIWWTVRSLVRLDLDDDELVISNYRSEIRVPLANVVSISGRSKTNPPRYTLTFEEPTEFGQRVSFLPPMQWSLIRLSESEEVRELRNAWETARAASARGAR